MVKTLFIKGLSLFSLEENWKNDAKKDRYISSKIVELTPFLPNFDTIFDTSSTLRINHCKFLDILCLNLHKLLNVTLIHQLDRIVHPQ